MTLVSRDRPMNYLVIAGNPSLVEHVTKGMRRGRILSRALAGALVLGACSGGSDREQPKDRPSPSAAASDAPGKSRGDRSSLSGRIAFDNHEDVWRINAYGTDLTRLTRSPAFEFDP